MKRPPPRQHGRDDAMPMLPPVAHQVEQAGRVAHRLARDRIHRDGRQRHEQQRQRRRPGGAAARRCPSSRPADSAAPARAACTPPTSRPSASSLRGSNRPVSRPTSGIMMNEPMPRGAIAMPGLQRRIAEQRLQHDRQQHQAAVEHEAERSSSGTRRRRSSRSLNTRRSTTGSLGPSARGRRARPASTALTIASVVIKRRGEPVVLLALVEHDLQRADADAPACRCPSSRCACDSLPQVRRIEDVQLAS